MYKSLISSLAYGIPTQRNKRPRSDLHGRFRFLCHLYLFWSHDFSGIDYQVSAPHLSTTLLTSVLHHCRSVGMARLYLTFTSSSTAAFELYTCTTQGRRHVTHIAFTMVGLVTTQPTSWFTLTITHHKTNT
jgi:hypothetical protein